MRLKDIVIENEILKSSYKKAYKHSGSKLKSIIIDYFMLPNEERMNLPLLYFVLSKQGTYHFKMNKKILDIPIIQK